MTDRENKTDIRLKSTCSEIEAVIELKLADRYSANDLIESISKQLVEKYLAPAERRSGCLLIVLTKNRSWRCPENKSTLDFDQLIGLLEKEANSIVEEIGNDLRIHVHGLDLRPKT